MELVTFKLFLLKSTSNVCFAYILLYVLIYLFMYSQVNVLLIKQKSPPPPPNVFKKGLFHAGGELQNVVYSLDLSEGHLGPLLLIERAQGSGV